MRSTLRAATGRIGLLTASLLLSLAVLEAGLQAGAWSIARSNRQQDAALPSSAQRVVCLGDSNTFGLYVGKENAFPALLETYWNADPARRPVDVVNLGYPGTNSSVLRNRFLDVLDHFHPSIVMMLVGVNDFWTVPEPPAEQGRAFTELRVWLWRHCRTFRLAYMLNQSRVDAQEEKLPGVTDDSRWAPAPGGCPDWPQAYADNVATMLGEARAAGARPLLLTYASGDGVYGQANQVIRRTARETGTALIDVAPDFAPLCPHGQCDLLFPDQHPTIAGHQRMARRIVDELAARNLLDGESP